MADTTSGLDSLNDDERQTGAAVKATGRGLSPVGTIAMDPTQTAELLANMQDMVDQRTGAFNTFMSGLQRASAWGSGGEKGPAAALTAMDQQKLAEDKELFNMRQQMAALRSSAAQQQAFNERKRLELTGGEGAGVPGVPGAPGAARSVFDQMPAEIKRALSNARTQEEWNSIYNPYAQKIAQSQAQFRYNPATYETKIKFVNPETQELEYIDAETAKRYKEAGYGANIIMPTRQAVPSATRAPADTLSAIKTGIFNQESLGGKLDTSKPNYAGAIGPMQILPDTFEGLKKEGLIPENYNINNPQHNKIAGDALIDKYYKQYGGNVDKVMAAYYGGPGAIKPDGTIDVNRRDPRNPNAPTVGEYIAQAKQKAGLTTAPAEVAVGAPKRVTIPQAESQLESVTKGRTKEFEETGKEISMQRAATVEAGSSADSRIQYSNRLNNLVTSNPKAFGVLADPNIASGFATLLKKGIQAGNSGAVGLPGLEDFVRQSMSGAKDEDIIAAQKALNIFAKLALDEAKIVLKGQGAVSNMERELVEQSVTSLSSRPEVIKDYLTYTKMRAEYDKQIGDLYRQFEKRNPNVSFNEFRLSDQYEAAKNAYAKRVDDYIEKSHLSSMVSSGKAPAAPAPQWKHSDADYEAWKKSRGLK